MARHSLIVPLIVSGAVLCRAFAGDGVASRMTPATLAAPAPCANVGASYVRNTTRPKRPPFSGTIFFPNIITASDPTNFTRYTYKGKGVRSMYDRRTDRFNDVNAHLFDVRFGSLTVEAQVNPEFSRAEAEAQLNIYLPAIGRLPDFLQAGVQTLWIHKGVNPLGGGNDNLLIHTGQGQEYIDEGILEEAFVHEATHTSLDETHAANALWRQAQAEDRGAISEYARDNPDGEDVAETVLMYLAQKYRPAALTRAQRDAIQRAIPNRIRYAECQGWALRSR